LGIGDIRQVKTFDPALVDMPKVVRMMRHPHMRGVAALNSSHQIVRIVAPLLTAGLGVQICQTQSEAIAFLMSKLKAAPIQ
jgi:hypothetical protein